MTTIKRLFDIEFLRQIARSIMQYKKQYFLGTLTVILINGIEMLPPVIFKTIMNAKNTAALPYSLGLMGITLLVGHLLVGAFRFGWRYYFMITSRRIEADLRRDLYGKILDGKFLSISQLKVGETISNLSQDTSDYRMLLGPGMLIFVDMITYYVFVPSILYWALGPLSFLLLLPMLIIPVFMFYYESRVNKGHRVSSELLASISDHVYEDTLGVRIFKILGMIGIRKCKFKDMILELFDLRMGIARLDMALESVLKGVIFLCYGLLLGLTYLALNKISSDLKPFAVLGSVVLAWQLLDKMIWPLMGIAYFASLYQKGRAAYHRLSVLRDIPVGQSGRTILIEDLGQVNLNHFSFKYPRSQGLALTDICFEAKSGEKIGIVGSVGSGKSTMLKVLATLFNPEDFHLNSTYFINEKDYRDLDVEGVRRYISYISQESVIFNNSVLRNIAAETDAPESKVWESLDRANIKEEVESLPELLRTPIGEKGVNLSGGQKQRICIARSFYTGANLYLWDDSISALDMATERKVISSVFDLNPKSILVLATHRPSALAHFDRIYVLDQGKMVEKGTFEELLENRGTFWDLYEFENKTRNIQKKEQEVCPPLTTRSF